MNRRRIGQTEYLNC